MRGMLWSCRRSLIGRVAVLPRGARRTTMQISILLMSGEFRKIQMILTMERRMSYIRPNPGYGFSSERLICRWAIHKVM